MFFRVLITDEFMTIFSTAMQYFTLTAKETTRIKSVTVLIDDRQHSEKGTWSGAWDIQFFSVRGPRREREAHWSFERPIFLPVGTTLAHPWSNPIAKGRVWQASRSFLQPKRLKLREGEQDRVPDGVIRLRYSDQDIYSYLKIESGESDPPVPPIEAETFNRRSEKTKQRISEWWHRFTVAIHNFTYSEDLTYSTVDHELQTLSHPLSRIGTGVLKITWAPDYNLSHPLSRIGTVVTLNYRELQTTIPVPPVKSDRDRGYSRDNAFGDLFHQWLLARQRERRPVG